MVFEVPGLGLPAFRVEALGVSIFSVSVWGSQFDDVPGFGPYYRLCCFSWEAPFYNVLNANPKNNIGCCK